MLERNGFYFIQPTIKQNIYTEPRTKIRATFLAKFITGAAIFISFFFGVASTAQTKKLTREEVESDVAKMDVMQTILSSLSVAYDLKDQGFYHCTYKLDEQYKGCTHLDTVSGQYEDFYWSTMTACQGSELCPGANINFSFPKVITSSDRLCRDIITKSCTKATINEDAMKTQLIDMIMIWQNRKDILE